MKKFTFTWRIENIDYSWHKTGEPICSPQFTAGPIHNSVWILYLLPRGQINPNYLSLFLFRGEDDGPANLSINFEVCCIPDDNYALHSARFTDNDKSFTKRGPSYGFSRFMPYHKVFIQRKALYIPGNVLTLRCKIWKDEGTEDEFGHCLGHTTLVMERVLLYEKLNYETSEDSVVNIHSERLNTTLITIRIMYSESCTKLSITSTNNENIKISVLRLAFFDHTTFKTLHHQKWTWYGAPQNDSWRVPLVFTGNGDSVQHNVQLFIEFIFSTGQESRYIVNDGSYSPRVPDLVIRYKTTCGQNRNHSDCSRIYKKLWNLFEEHDVCDMELKTETTSFFVHKFVLCARSPVFLSMLTYDMKEKTDKCIEINDIADGILSKFLHFLYTDAFKNLEWDVVIGLYYAADKYRVDRLKILCSSYLLKNINYLNFRELLTLADRHSDFDLKRRVEDCILQKDKKILRCSSRNQFKEQTLQPARTGNSRSVEEQGRENPVDTYEEILSGLLNIQGDFTAAYESGIVSDVIIKTTGATFHAHKAVLCASSPTWREMFTTDSTDVLEIADFETDIVSIALRFLYSDNLGYQPWNTLIKLYHAAAVYHIQRLKMSCACYLLGYLETSNASELLLLAVEHKDTILKQAVEYYILLHDEEIFGSVEWANFSKSNLSLANEIMLSRYTTGLNRLQM